MNTFITPLQFSTFSEFVVVFLCLIFVFIVIIVTTTTITITTI